MPRTKRRPRPLGTPITTHRMVVLYTATLPLLVALRDVARPLAARRTNVAVPPAIAAQARTLLADARRIVSREPRLRGLLELHEPIDWPSLHGKLELALAALASFAKRHSYVDRDFGHTWRDESWVNFQRHQLESTVTNKDLHES